MSMKAAVPLKAALCRRPLVSVVTLALVVRVAYWSIFHRHYVPASDAAHYHEIALNVAEGEGFFHFFPQLEEHATAFRPPLYPLLLSLPYRVLWPTVAIAQVMNLVLGCAVVALTFVLVQRIAGRRAATVSAILASVYPPLLANDVVPLAEPLALCLLLGLALCLRSQQFLGAGVLTGLLVLSRTSAQGVAVIVVLWVLATLGKRQAAVALAVAGLVVAPWVVRNQIALGTPTLVTSNGFNLAALHSPEARESGRFVDPVFDPRFEEFRIYQFDEVEWDRKLSSYAIAEIRRDPLASFDVVLRNLAAMAELKPSYNASAERLDGRVAGLRTASLPLFYAVSVVGVVGLWRHRADGSVRFLAVVTAYFLALSLLFVAPPRLRAPFDLLSVIGVGLFVASAEARRVSRRDVEDAAGDDAGGASSFAAPTEVRRRDP